MKLSEQIAIFEKYGDFYLSAEHDQIWIVYSRDNKNPVSEEDAEILEKNDWTIDDEYNYWTLFV